MTWVLQIWIANLIDICWWLQKLLYFFYKVVHWNLSTQAGVIMLGKANGGSSGWSFETRASSWGIHKTAGSWDWATEPPGKLTPLLVVSASSAKSCILMKYWQMTGASEGGWYTERKNDFAVPWRQNQKAWDTLQRTTVCGLLSCRREEHVDGGNPANTRESGP